MKRFLLFTLACFATVAAVVAQTPTEILRYSQIRPGGTARALGVGGAFGALGGDYTGVGINPGGLGIYRRSDLSVSFGVQNTVSNTDLMGNAVDANRVRAYLPNASIVLSRLHVDARGNRRRGKWIASNFAFGINRLANFNANSVFINPQSPNSLLGQYRDELTSAGLTEDQISLNNFSDGAYLGYYNYLLNPVGSAGTEYAAVTDGYVVNQQISLVRRGGIDEMSFAFGSNYNDKFYFGALIGVPFLTYRQKLNVRESDDNNSIPVFNNYAFTQDLSTDGVGVNAKFGFVVRAAKWMRFGASFHTPTRYSVSDNYYTEITSSIDSLPYNNDFTEGAFDYQLSTPWRTITSASFIIKQFGFVSVDYEYSNYNRAKYTFSGFENAETALNQEVRNYLKAVHTLRAGAEVAAKNWRIRGGYSFTTSPVEQNQVLNGRDLVSQTFSGGVGYRGKRWYIDMAYYRIAAEGTAVISSNIVSGEKLTFDNYVMTVGLNF